MTTFWKTFVEFWQVWGPFIATSLVPTILTGLSVSPKTVKAKNLVQKIWNFIKYVLDFLSLATPKDVPGTFQLPFKLGTILSKDTKTITTLALVFALSTNQGCAWLSSTGKEAKNVSINCIKDAARTKVSSLVPTVIGVLTGGAVNWKEQLTVLMDGFGRTTTACAIQVAYQRLTDPVASEATEDPESVRVASIKRAASYIKEQDWSFTQ